MKKLSVTLAIVVLATTLSLAQKDETLFGSRGLHLTGAWGGPITSLTFFNDDFAVISGGYGGLEFGKNVFVGWGGFGTNDDFVIEEFQNERFDLSYNGPMIGYSFKAHKIIHPEVMVLIGGGRIRVPGERSDRVFVFQPSAGFEANILRWFRFGIRGGYRFIADTDLLDLTSSDVSAPFGELTFKFGWSWGW